jgi:hypothetical protein
MISLFAVGNEGSVMIFHGDNATLPFTFYQKYIHNITYADDDLLVSIRARRQV